MVILYLLHCGRCYEHILVAVKHLTINKIVRLIRNLFLFIVFYCTWVDLCLLKPLELVQSFFTFIGTKEIGARKHWRWLWWIITPENCLHLQFYCLINIFIPVVCSIYIVSNYLSRKNYFCWFQYISIWCKYITEHNLQLLSQDLSISYRIFGS